MQAPHGVQQLWVVLKQVQHILSSNAQQAAFAVAQDVVVTLGLGETLQKQPLLSICHIYIPKNGTSDKCWVQYNGMMSLLTYLKVSEHIALSKHGTLRDPEQFGFQVQVQHVQLAAHEDEHITTSLTFKVQKNLNNHIGG